MGDSDGQDEEKQETGVGGLNHIPGFSSSEEKMLEYASEDEEVDNAAAALDDYIDDEVIESVTSSSRLRHKHQFDIVTKLLRIVESQALQVMKWPFV